MSRDSLNRLAGKAPTQAVLFGSPFELLVLLRSRSFLHRPVLNAPYSPAGTSQLDVPTGADIGPYVGRDRTLRRPRRGHAAEVTKL